jgi:hypothetical protein
MTTTLLDIQTMSNEDLAGFIAACELLRANAKKQGSCYGDITLRINWALKEQGYRR